MYVLWGKSQTPNRENLYLSGVNPSSQIFQTPLVYLKGVGPQRAKIMAEVFGLHTFVDLLHFFPFRYVDKTQWVTIAQLQPNLAEIQIKGTLVNLEEVPQKRGSRLVGHFSDETGSMELVWFKGTKWLRQNLKIGQQYSVFGKVQRFGSSYSMPHPDMEVYPPEKVQFTASIRPIYPSSERLQTAQISQKIMGGWVMELLLQYGKHLEETLPNSLMERHGFIGLPQALFHIHFPKNLNLLAQAQKRLKFEELFFIQLQLLRNKAIRRSKVKGYPFNQVGRYFNEFYQHHLPFELTNAQKRVVKEIRSDLGSNAQMNRLLQGDVGSGKTMVAVLCFLMAVDNGFQSCLVAPTEILAQQHFRGISDLLAPVGLRVALLTGSVKNKERTNLLADLKDGNIHVLVGTHALFEDTVIFHHLGLAVIDEQHRFGVAQRAKLWHKNDIPPHVLVMTATPIPRTLAMSLYGDLDISVIDELPPGRQEIKTVWRTDAHRLKVFGFIKQQIALGRQVYMVYPLINESQAMDYKDLMDGYESITREFPMPEYQVSIVHGQMKSDDKAIEMDRFVRGISQIMVATTVIEVGVNVPNASVMVIESAERFGLSQLHQLRGRVGRGAEQSYCILMSADQISEDAKLRLHTMTQTNDGFALSEVDLKLRGPGDLMGTQQSGVLQLKIADLTKDQELLSLARKEAMRILHTDPTLSQTEHLVLKKAFEAVLRHKNIWNYIS